MEEQTLPQNRKPPVLQYQIEHIEAFSSQLLRRKVTVDLYLPPGYFYFNRNYPFLVLNDGQDSKAVRIKKNLEKLLNTDQICEVIVIAIHADGNRMQEYGIAAGKD